MRALEFITSHVIYNPAYTYKFQLKTTHVQLSEKPTMVAFDTLYWLDERTKQTSPSLL